MRILFIGPRYAPAKGGAEKVTITMASWAAKNPNNIVDVWTTDAFEVDALWYPGKQKVEKEEEIIDGVNVKRFKTTPFLMNNIFVNKSIRYLLVHNPIPLLRILGTPPTCFGMWMQIFNKNLPKYDVVHVDCMPYYSLIYIARAIAQKTGAKLYLSPRTHLGTDRKDPLYKKYFDPVGVSMYCDCDKLFTQTDVEKKAIQNFVKENGREIEDERFEKVAMGIWPEEVGIGKAENFIKKYKIKEPVVCSIGAKNFVKGHFTLVKAMEILWKQGIKVKLAMGGNHSIEFDNFWKKQSKLVKENTINLNMPNDQEKFDMLAACDVFSLTSKSESFGIVYLEAWYYKKPVIAANIDIIKEVVQEGVDGYSVDFNNAKALAEKIKVLLKDKKHREELGNNGYNKVVKEYTWDKRLKILEKYFY